MKETPMVIVVDDDQSVQESLPDLIRECGFFSKAYASAQEFLASGDLEHADCLIVDIAMPDMTGPELQIEVNRLQKDLPIIFITAMQNDAIHTSVLEEGAKVWLMKPFGDKELLDAIAASLAM